MHRIGGVLVAGMLSSAYTLATQAIDSAPPQAPAAGRAIGIDVAGMDASIGPGSDFDGYANGSWNRFTRIPDDGSSYNVYVQINDRTERRVAALIRDIDASRSDSGTNARRAADYYAAYMDAAGIERRGMDPLRPRLAEIDGVASRSDLARVLGDGLRADVDPLNVTRFQTDRLFGLFVAQDLHDPARPMAYLLQGGLGLPGRDYYLSADPAMARCRSSYRSYIADMLSLAGIADSGARALSILDLETKIAKAQVGIVESQDVRSVGPPWSIADFATKAPGLDWATWFKAAGLDGQKQIVAWQPAAIGRLSALVASEPLQAWEDYLRFHLIDENADLLPAAFSNRSFEFHGHVLEGRTRQRDRWRRAVGLVDADLGDAVGQMYVERWFPATSKAQVTQIVDNLVAAFGERLDGLAWMSPATRAKARAKLAALRVGIGYPDRWRDDAALEIRRDDPVGNHLRAELFEYRHQLARLDRPVDRDAWWLSPQTVNAVNLPLQNALDFPAAILVPPFFDPDADAAANYGAIGAIIGHEISHDFDASGAEFDPEGRLANWWTPEDYAHFKAAAGRLAAQFDSYEALPGIRVNGEQTLNENIADLSGLAIAFAAYRKSLGGHAAPVLRGLSGEQRFFIAYAQAWRERTREPALREQIATEVHAPARYRAQTVRNIDGWYEAFSPKQGDALYLDPNDRIRIW